MKRRTRPHAQFTEYEAYCARGLIAHWSILWCGRCWDYDASIWLLRLVGNWKNLASGTLTSTRKDLTKSGELDVG